MSDTNERTDARERNPYQPDITTTTVGPDGVLYPSFTHAETVFMYLQTEDVGEDTLGQFAELIRDSYVGEANDSRARQSLSEANRAALDGESLEYTGKGLLALAVIAAWRLSDGGDMRVSCATLAVDGNDGQPGDWPAGAELYVIWLPAAPGAVRFSVSTCTTDGLAPWSNWQFELHGRRVTFGAPATDVQ